MADTVFALVMVKNVDQHYVRDLETWLRDSLHSRYGAGAQVQMLGNEDEALPAMWKVRQRILERRQRESRESR